MGFTNFDSVDFSAVSQRASSAVAAPLPVVIPDILRRTPATLDVRRALSKYALGTLPQDALKPARVRTFYVDLDNVTGFANDNNTGLTKAGALLTLPAARAKLTADSDAIIIFGVKQDRIVRETANWATPNVSFSIINESPARVIFARTGSSTAPTWTAVSGQPGVYSTPIATVADAANIIDTANRVDMAARVRVPVGGTTADQQRWQDAVRRTPAAYHAPIRVASIAAVAALPGSWFYDSAGQLLYVQAIDGRNLVGDTKMQPLSTGVYTRASNGNAKTVYYYGLDFAGGSPPIFVNPAVDTNPNCLLIAEYCSWQCSASAGGSTSAFAINGPYKVIQYRCATWFSWADGFSYTSLLGIGTGTNIDDPSPTVFEIECAAGGGGTTGSTGPSDNDFTAHVSTDVASINCVAVGSSDRPVAYVHKVRSLWVGGYIGAPIDTGGASLSNHGTADLVQAYIIGTQFAPPQPGTPNVLAEGSAQVTLIGVHPDVTRTQLGNAVINNVAA